MHVKAPDVNFFGWLYNADGVHADQDKVNAIHALPVPTNITKLQEFLGLVMYLSPFIPGLSTLTAPLHELLKKDTDFIWNSHLWGCTFQHVSRRLSSVTLPIRYVNPSLPITIQVDASQVGLDTLLLQEQQTLLPLPAKSSPKLNTVTPT